MYRGVGVCIGVWECVGTWECVWTRKCVGMWVSVCLCGYVCGGGVTKETYY